MLRYLAIILLLSTLTVLGQGAPQAGALADDTIIVNSGSNFILVPDLSDGDDGNQSLSFTISLSEQGILSVDSISHQQDRNFAVIWVSEQGNLGSTELYLEVSDTDGVHYDTASLTVSNYSNHGIKFEIHDAVFWQEVVPLTATPVYDTLISNTDLESAYTRVPWGTFELTVSAGCNNPNLCTGRDFHTGFAEGYISPLESGDYTFYMSGANDYSLYLSSDASFDNAVPIARKSDQDGDVGEEDNGRKSAPVTLEAGKVYAMYAAQWNVHAEQGAVEWEGPGFSRQPIGTDFIYPEYDTIRPAPVDELQVKARGVDFLWLDWEPSIDNARIDGYRVYVNGLPSQEELLTQTEYIVPDLTPGTDYDITITAIDQVDNESLIGSIVSTSTYAPDDNPPSPPTNLEVTTETGVALEVSWTGAQDSETEVIGYNLYLDGEQYNSSGFIAGEEIILKVLQPQTTYQVQLEAVDAGANISARSDAFSVTTPAFDPDSENLGVKAGRMILHDSTISFNYGIGVNPSYKGGLVFNQDHDEVLADLRPGALRWGALTANPLHFADYVGAGKSLTIGRFMNRASQFDAYTAFVCGVENSTDWMTDSTTFLTFLEYINGPDDSPGGQLRVAEGYSEPFLANSPGLIFEFGNEVWGQTSHNAQIGSNYGEYAEWARKMAETMRASPYYDAEKIFLCYSTRYPSINNSFGLNQLVIKGDSGEVDWTAPSGYLGGNLEYDPDLSAGASELAYYENLRNYAWDQLNGMVGSHRYEIRETGRPMQMYLYESNATTPTYNGRMGQGIISLDYYVEGMNRGAAIPTIFHLSGGQWRITEPENNYRRLPLFVLAKYFNHLCRGDNLLTTYESVNSDVGTFGYRTEDGYALLLISRDFTEDHYVQLDLPSSLTEATAYVITSPTFSSKETTVDTMAISTADGGLIRVPAFGAVYVHYPMETSLEMLPLGYFSYVKQSQIQLEATATSITENRGQVIINASVLPEDALLQGVRWQIDDGEVSYIPIISGNELKIFGSGGCNGNGEITIRALSLDDPDIFTETTLPISGQGQDCVVTDLLDMETWSIYPNPASQKIRIRGNASTFQALEIFDQEGRLLKRWTTWYPDGFLVSEFGTGIYYVKVYSDGELVTERVILE